MYPNSKIFLRKLEYFVEPTANNFSKECYKLRKIMQILGIFDEMSEIMFNDLLNNYFISYGICMEVQNTYKSYLMSCMNDSK